MKVGPGYQSGMLTVVAKGSGRMWLCTCSCGNEKLVRYDCLHKQTTTSCGCNDANATRHDKALERAEEVWKMYVRLASMKAVAARLGISKQHVHRIIRRLET